MVIVYNIEMNIIFIDGENIKGRINEVFKKHKIPLPEWEKYDFKGLFDEVFDLEDLKNAPKKFYRAMPKSHPDIVDFYKQIERSYRNLGGHLSRQGFEVIRAGTLRADYRNKSDKRPTFREKGVDVFLAVSMVSMACDNKLNSAYLVASDSDYQPAVAELRRRGKKVVYVGFEVNPNLGLIAKTNDRIIISDKIVLNFGKTLLK